MRNFRSQKAALSLRLWNINTGRFPWKESSLTLVLGISLQEVLGTLIPAQLGTDASLVLGGILRNEEF